jgi:trk system potassium uptake protein
VKKQVVVMGLGRFGISVATTLYEMGNDVLALDKDEKNLANITSQLTRIAQADTTNESVLRDLGIKDYDVAIVSMGSSIESSVLSTILAKRLGVKYVISRANSELHGSILEKIGADLVVYPERETGIRAAHNTTVRDASDYMPISHRYGIAKLSAEIYFIKKTLSDLGFGPRGKYGVAVLMIQRKNEIIVTPDLNEIVKEKDILVVSGDDEKIEKLIEDAKGNQKN